ncbi:YhgE/Pip domain-containing protein [Rhodococcus sp. NPDC004095]
MAVSALSESRLRRWWPVLALTVGVLVVGAGLGLGLRSPAPSSQAVAIVNEDNGSAGMGERVIDTLESSGDFSWEVVDADTAAAGNYLAAVTIPEDFSDAVVSLGSTTPRQAELSVRRGAAADADAMSRLTATVSEVTSATGIRNLLSGMASARAQLQQAMLPAQLLTTATAAADTQARQMLGGVEEMLPYLQTANDGANQLVDVAGQVSGMVSQARGPATELSTRLTELGVTIGDVTTGVGRLETGLDAVASRVAGLDADAAHSLERTSADLAELSRQLTAITGLLGTGVGPDTDLGSAIGSGFGQLESVSAQLSEAGGQLQSGIGPIAAQAPELLGSTTDQILAGVSQLKSVSTQLGEQLTKGIDAIPARSGVQQDAMSTTMAAPVAVIETGGTAGPGLLDTRNLMVLFAGTTVALGAALAWIGTRRAGYRPATETAGS